MCAGEQERREDAGGILAVRSPGIPTAPARPVHLYIRMTQAQLTAVAGPFALGEFSTGDRHTA
ncbi:hypothetical protein GCM10027028_35730 [Streptomyces sundarbansensis]